MLAAHVCARSRRLKRDGNILFLSKNVNQPTAICCWFNLHIYQKVMFTPLQSN